MKFKLMSLGLGLLLSLGILLFMAALVEPPKERSQRDEQDPIVIRMQTEQSEVAQRERPVPPKPEPLPEPPAALSLSPMPTPTTPPLPSVQPSLDLVADLSPVQVAAPGVLAAPAPAAVAAGNPHGQLNGVGSSDILTPLQRIEPAYPYRAQQAGIEGFVTLSFAVDAQGRVQDVTVVEAKPRRQFERAAIQAVSKWRYQPRPGASDKLPQVITLKFKLES